MLRGRPLARRRAERADDQLRLHHHHSLVDQREAAFFLRAERHCAPVSMGHSATCSSACWVHSPFLGDNDILTARVAQVCLSSILLCVYVCVCACVCVCVCVCLSVCLSVSLSICLSVFFSQSILASCCCILALRSHTEPVRCLLQRYRSGQDIGVSVPADFGGLIDSHLLDHHQIQSRSELRPAAARGQLGRCRAAGVQFGLRSAHTHSTTHTHARTHTHTHARTHARSHARTHAHVIPLMRKPKKIK